MGYVGTSFLLQLVGTDSKTAGISKGLQIPWILGFQEGRKCPVGTRFCVAKSSVLYLLRPLLPERGCYLTKQTVSGDSRTDGFWRATGRNLGFVPQTKSGCSGVGGAAQWRGF